MVTLAEAVNATTRLLPVSGDVSAAVLGRQYRIDDEIVTLRAFERDWDAIGKPVNENRWLVTRGAEHSVAVSHTLGAEVVASVDASVSSETLAPPAPFASEGGGAVSVDNGVDPPAAVSTIVAPGATIMGDEATLSVPVYSSIVTLTDAQIKALGSGTSVTVVPAPGVGKTINFVSAFVVLDSTGGGYTNIDEAAYIKFSLEGFTVSVPCVGSDANLLLDAFGGGVYGAFFAPATRATSNDINLVSAVKDVPNFIDNYALQIAGGNGVAGAFTGGDAANTLKITVLYMVIDI